MGALETIQARQAALLLHALPPDVQKRVVAKLDVAESARLQPLLDELVALGVSQSLGERLQRVLLPAQTSASTPVSPATVAELAVHGQVARLDARVIVQCLQGCAPVTVAQLLRSRDWPWKADVLELMPEARRAEMLELMSNQSTELAPAVLQAMCERLCRRAAHLIAPTGRPRSTALKRLLAWIR
jgi:hypothetical protein